MTEIRVRVEGPFFDARSRAATAALEREAVWDVASQGLSEVHQILNERIQNPTPYYETQLVIERVGPGAVALVHDRGIVYGPWLEGTSERNRTTRFKGYKAFRLARQRVKARVPQLVERALQRYVIRLGG